MELITGLFSAFGLSASAGLNAYIPLLTLALLTRYTDLIKLSSPWDGIANGWIIALLLVLSLIEFFADKVPAVNHINDAIQTFVRPTAGAIVFAASAQVITEINPVLSLAAGLFVAGGVHAVKSLAIRPLVTATTAGIGDVPVSIAEDIISTALSILSILIPVLAFLFVLVVIVWIIHKFRRRENQRRLLKP
jgi:hypothetical protein